MEHQKKLHHQQKAHQKSQRDKHKFFEEVYKQCESIFPIKQFQFFTKCIIPHRTMNHSSSTHRKSINSNLIQQKQTNINDINPNVLTMPRRLNFYQEKSINSISLERVNKRILTTPTEKIRRQVKFQNYEDYQLYKKMKEYQKNLTNDPGQHNKDKIYVPEPLFYPHSRLEVPQIIFSRKQRGNKSSRYRNSRNQCQKSKDLSIQKRNIELIPDYFIQIVKSSQNFKPYRCSKTGYMRSVRS